MGVVIGMDDGLGKIFLLSLFGEKKKKKPRAKMVRVANVRGFPFI